jgi:hypothetical protein
MTLDYDTCPYCGQKVLKGALRCVGCRKILKTPEEQAESLERLKSLKKKFNLSGLIKFILFLISLGLIYHFFSEQILEFIAPFLENTGLINNGK